jgi:pimeloyl-ACP methyl ester carboxylesterase
LRVLLNICVIFSLFLNSYLYADYTEGYVKVNQFPLYYQLYSNNHAVFHGTIIFENGSGTTLNEWTKNTDFFNKVKQLGNVFIYDRSGLGKSPPDLSLSAQKPMTAKFVSDKLSVIIQKAKLPAPYVVVAHSYGAMYAGYFAKKHPLLVKAVVFIDPVPPRYSWSTALLKSTSTTQSEFVEMKKLPASVLYKKYGFDRLNNKKELPAQLFYQLIGFNKTKQQLASLPPISQSIPVKIISSTYMQKNAPIKGNWMELQKKWLNQNPHSKIIQIKSGHFIQLEHPDVVYKQIKQAVLIAKN